eukprot:scaffold368814_cov27-Prasinocladus_malaysianus.AAC.2
MLSSTTTLVAASKAETGGCSAEGLGDIGTSDNASRALSRLLLVINWRRTTMPAGVNDNLADGTMFALSASSSSRE